jgi:hypothetical protein
MDKKWIMITQEDKEDELNNLVIKVKFFALEKLEEDDTSKERFRVSFTRKRGDRMEWYNLFTEMKETFLGDILLATKNQ